MLYWFAVVNLFCNVVLFLLFYLTVFYVLFLWFCFAVLCFLFLWFCFTIVLFVFVSLLFVLPFCLFFAGFCLFDLCWSVFFFCFFVVFFCFFCCCFVRDTALIKGIKYIFCSLIIATVNHVFQSLDKVIMEMSTCDEPRPHNGPSPIATVSGQRSVSVDPFYLP